MEKRLGALPVAAEFLRRLDVAGIVDGLCPSGPSAHLTHGQVIEALVANRLTSPTIPLFRVGDRARTWAVEEVLGIEAGLLNDDRLARALDAIAPKLEQLAGTVGARAITEFGIDVSRLHWDMTSMSVHGAYPLEDQDDAFPVIKHGHPKDRRVDLKQVQAGLAVSGDGGIPVHARVFGGGAAEVSQVVGAMKDLQKLADEREFLLVADSKLVSYPNVAALLAARTAFIAPVPAAQVKNGFYAALDLGAATVVDWAPDRDAGKVPAQREVYRVLEDVHTLNGPRKRDPVLSVRRILVHSTGNAAGQQAARTKRLTRAAEDLDKVQHGAGGKYYNTAEKIAARIGVIAKTRRVASCLRTEIGEDDAGRPHPGLALRPAGPGRRGGGRRLVRAADGADSRAGRPEPGPDPVQGPGIGRAPLRGLQGSPGGHPAVRAAQPPRRRPDPGHLSGSAGLQPDRTPGQTSPGP
ncbi:IS1634 family transposase [Kitasatospora herbaricolor]|uniref:IS1634 family transposase n=1 Tax=Kitasatospora herbaricolor TaxID=68217 RepID=A0ABZ1WJA1_9ACTN|nr:IS1634 family transposase [Kitasatospora herbaricolor]